MLKRKWNIALTLAACALFLLTSVSAKQQVERPFRIQATGMTDLTTGIDQQWGQATHCGLFTNLGQGTGPGTTSGLGTTANGDQISWDATYTETPEGTIDLTVTFTGGTGRFVGCSGSFHTVYTGTVDWTTMTFSYTYIGMGTITY